MISVHNTVSKNTVLNDKWHMVKRVMLKILVVAWSQTDAAAYGTYQRVFRFVEVGEALKRRNDCTTTCRAKGFQDMQMYNLQSWKG